MAAVYLVSDRPELDRRRALVGRATILEIWPDLYAPDILWLGDDEARRIAYGTAREGQPTGAYWLGEASKQALDRVGPPPLAFRLAMPETAVPIYYGPRLRDPESLPSEESLRARVLSAHGIAVLWATYDGSGARVEPPAPAPTDATFFLRRPGGGAIHLWRLFRTRAAASAHVAEHLPDDADARRWAETLPVADFEGLVARYGAPEGAD